MKAKLDYQTLVHRPSQNSIFRSMKRYRDLLPLFIKGTIEPILFVGGPPGVGKTWELERAAKVLNASYIPIAPGTSPDSFVGAIHEYNDYNILSLDDHDKLLTSPKAKEIVKQGWGPARMIRWETRRSFQVGDPPPQFKVRSKLAWISNRDANQWADDIDLQAIFDRGADPIWIDGSDQAMFEYSIYLATVGNMFEVSKNFVSRKIAIEAVNWFNAHRNSLKSLSPRTLNAVAGYMQKNKTPATRKLALSKKLAATKLRNIPGFGQLEMVTRGVWKEVNG